MNVKCKKLFEDELDSKVGAGNSLLHNGIDTNKAFTKIGRNTTWLPTKTNSDFVNSGTSQMEAKRCCHVIGVSYDTINIDPTIVIRIRIGSNACHPKKITYVLIPNACCILPFCCWQY